MEIMAMIGLLLGVLIFVALCYILSTLKTTLSAVMTILDGVRAVRKEIESQRNA